MAESPAKWHFDEARPLPPVEISDEAERRLRRVNRLAWVLDRSIPLGKWRIRLDPILGILPGFGDWIGAGLSLYVLYEGARLGMRGGVLARMTANILVETIVGTVPVVGDLFDFAWRANTRNMFLIRQHYRPGQAPRSMGWVWAVMGGVSLGVLTLVGTLGYFVVQTTAGLLGR